MFWRSILLLLLCFPTIASAQKQAAPADPYAASQQIVGDIQKIVAPTGVDDTFVATLGGAPQVVNVRGNDRANPILIFVHGGPGAVEMPIAWAFQRPWEDFFTVVQWDQRGAGRSYRLEDPKALEPTMKFDRYVDDTIELINLLRSKYGKRKVFLMGHSWGTAVGLAVAAKRPDLLYAYVGVGQIVDQQQSERLNYNWVLQRARSDHNDEAVKELDALQPYPGDFSSKKIDAERKWSVYYGGLFAYRRDVDFYFHAARLSPLYTVADRKAWDEGSEFTIVRMMPQLAKVSFTNVKRIGTPVVFFLGRHDHTVAAEPAANWIEQVNAPFKKVVWFENSAHMPFLEEQGHTLQALLNVVRPLAH